MKVDSESRTSRQKFRTEKPLPMAIETPDMRHVMAVHPPVPWYIGMQMYHLSPSGPGRWPQLKLPNLIASRYIRVLVNDAALGKPVVPLIISLSASPNYTLAPVDVSISPGEQ